MDTEQKRKTGKLGTELGASGVYIFNGLISGEEYNYSLMGQNGKKIYDIMRRSDSSVHSTLQVCKLPILSTTWEIEPASEDQADKDIADFVTNELFNRNVNWHDFLREALTMFDFGHSVFEKTYELTEFNGQTRVGLRSLASRKQRSILYWETAEHKPGVQQQLIGGNGITNSPTGIVSIPMPKLIIFTNEREGDNYEGISMLRFAYKDWDIKDKLTLVHAMALEKMAMGIPVITPPQGVNAGEQTRARESVRAMRANEESFIEKPAGWLVEMLDMKSQTTKDILPTLQYLEKNISKSVLAQFLELGSAGSGGSRALSQDHSALFMLSEEAAAKNVQSTIQKDLIHQMVDLNYSNLPNGYPKLKSGKIGDEDTTNIANAVNQLMTAGALTADPDLEDHLRSTLHFPLLPEELHTEYEKILKDSPGDLLKPAGPTPAPAPADPTIVPDDKKPPKKKASTLSDLLEYRSQLIQAVQLEYASERKS